MAYIYGNYGTTQRLTGLASGMDTDSIIKNMMQIEQMKVNRELRSRTLLEWKQEALKGVKTDMTDFRNSFLAPQGANSMLKSSTYIKFKTSTTDTSNAVSVTANSNNTASKVTINQVQRLASTAKAQSTVDGTTKKGSVLKSDLAEGNYVYLGDMEFTNALEFDENGNFSFEINGESFTFNKGDTLQHMLTTVSNNENAGVVLNFSRLSNTFTLQTKATGADAALSFSNITGNAFGTNGAFQLDTAGGTASDGSYVGENALLTIDGVTIEKDSNSFTIDGISYTLNKVTGADADIEFTIEKDVDSAVDAVKEFVEGYNTIIKKLESMLAEKKTKKEKNYTPLTDEEKSNMTEKQIEDWEKIAKKGILYNDSDIRSMLTALRNTMYETIEGTGVSAASLGIKTGSYFDGKQGEIDLDEDTLRAALEKDADLVMRAFMSTPDKNSDFAGGYIYRVQSIFDGYTKVTQANTLESMDKEMTKLNDKIEQMETRMAELEERYYLKFAAMEKAMAELQNQSNNLVSMLGSSK